MTFVVKTAQQLMADNMIVKHYAGSHAYGTAIATSDVDFRGIFVADPVNVRTPFYRIEEAKDTNEEDTVLYELSQFMKLVLDCNPNVVETLHVDLQDVVFSTPAYQLLRENASKLLSRKIAFTTSGYALAQLKRIKGHNKWITNPQNEKAPQQVDYISLVHNFTPQQVFKINLREFYKNYRLVPFSGDTYGLFEIDGHHPFNQKTGTLNVDYEGDSHELGTPKYIVKFNRQVFENAKETWSNYWTWKKNRNEKRSELEEKYGYDCYSDDTEFLTNTGWKKFDDVNDKDTLATFNSLSNRIEYQPPHERIESLYTGNMYHLKGYHVDTMVTANHNMYVRSHSRTTGRTSGIWEFQRAAELSETFDTLNVIVAKKNRGLLPPGFNTSVLNQIDMLNYLRLMGWWISDGTTTFRNGKVQHAVISQSKPQSKLTQTLTKQINYGKIPCIGKSINPASGLAKFPETTWRFPTEISTHLYNDCGHGSHSKRLPNWIFFLTKREMTTLLVALLQGDGTQRDHQNHTYVYYTVNQALADDVQRLAFLCGYETSLYGPYPMQNGLSDSSMYHVHINIRPPKTRRHTRYNGVSKTFVENQRIVCFMVNNYTLVTRRNGQIGLHGNTKHAMHLVRLLRMGAEALEEGVVKVRRPDAEELLAIRNGSWSYKEIVEYAERMDDHVRNVLYLKTDLPQHPDIKLAASLMLEVQNMVWSGKEN